MVEAISRKKKHNLNKKAQKDTFRDVSITSTTKEISSSSSDQPILDIEEEEEDRENITIIKQLSPVLDRIEKHVKKQVFHQDRIHEEHVQPIIEIREKPVAKDVYHPVEEIVIKEEAIYMTEGEEKLRNTLKTLGLTGEALDRQMVSTLAQYPPSIKNDVSSPAQVASCSTSITEESMDSSKTVTDTTAESIVPTLDTMTTVTTRIEKEIIKKQIIHEIHIQPVIYVHEPFDKLVQETHEFITEEVVPPPPLSDGGAVSTSTATVITTSQTTDRQQQRSSIQPVEITTDRVVNRSQQQPHKPGFFEKLKYSLFGPSRPYERPTGPIKSQVGDMHVVVSPKAQQSPPDYKGKGKLIPST